MQISPDKNMNCHDTTAGFTVQREFAAFVVMCQLDPLLSLISDFCSSARRFALRLPSDNPSRDCLCLRLVVMIVNMVNAEFSDRGLPPHKFMPMLGVHKALQPNAHPLRGLASTELHVSF